MCLKICEFKDLFHNYPNIKTAVQVGDRKIWIRLNYLLFLVWDNFLNDVDFFSIQMIWQVYISEIWLECTAYSAKPTKNSLIVWNCFWLKLFYFIVV